MRFKKEIIYYFIYETKHIISNKVYIGFHATNNLNDGYLGSGKLLLRAIKKYGKNNFNFSIIEFCNKENWKEKEKYWINKKNSICPNGYNLTSGGEGGDTFSLHSDEEKIKIKNNLAKPRKKCDEERKIKISKANKNKIPYNKGKIGLYKHSDDSKNKISEAVKGGKNPMFGKKHSIISILKIKNAKKGTIVSNETRQKISNFQKGKIKNKKICPNCKREIAINLFNRWHGDNCKFKI